MNVPIVVQRRMGNFLRHYWQLFRFAWAHIGTTRILLVAALGITAVAARGGILFLAAKFAGMMQGQQIQLYGVELSASNTLTTLILFSIPVFLLLFYSSFATYLAAKYTRWCGRRTEEELVRLFLVNAKSLGRTNLSNITGHRKALMEFFGRDRMQVGRSVEQMLRLIQPVVYIILALGAALHLEPVLSAILLLIASVTLPVFYLLSRRIQADSFEFFQRQNEQRSRVISDLIERLQATNVGPASRIDSTWLDKQPAFQSYLGAYDRMRLGADHMALRASLLYSLLIVGALIAFGWLAIEGQRSWSALVIYVGALAFFATGLQTFLRTLAILIKFYPQTRTGTALVERLERANQSVPAAPNPPSSINLAASEPLPGSERHRTIAKGDLSVLLTRTQLRRLSFRDLLKPLKSASDAPTRLWDAASFLAYDQPPPPDTVARAVLGEDCSESKRAWLEAFLTRANGGPYTEFLPDGLETELTAEQWNLLPERTRAALALAAVCTEARALLFLDSNFAAKLPAEFLRDLPTVHDVPYVFIVSNNLNLPTGADHYVVTNEDDVIGLGSLSWIQERQDLIAPLVSRRAEEDDDTLIDEDF